MDDTTHGAQAHDDRPRADDGPVDGDGRVAGGGPVDAVRGAGDGSEPAPEIPLVARPGQPPTAGRRGRARVVVAVVALVAVVAGVLAVRALGGDDADPDAALRRAGEALADAGSYRMTVTTEDRSGEDAVVGPGTHTVTRVVSEVEVSGEDWHARSDAGDWVDETVVVGGTWYARSGDSATPIEGEQWAAVPVPAAGAVEAPAEAWSWVAGDIRAMTEDDILPEDATFVDEMLVSMVGPLYLGGLGSPAVPPGGGAVGPVMASPSMIGPLMFGGGTVDPGALAVTLDGLDDAEVVADDGRQVTVRATRQAPDELTDAIDRPVPPGVFEVVLDAHDRPVSLTLTVEGGTASHEVRVDFRDWGADVAVAAPAEADIDPTPWLDEAALAEARAGITPLRPTVLPEGVELQDIHPMSADEAAEMGEEECARLNLVYGPPLPAISDVDDPAAITEAMVEFDGYLDVYLIPAACAQRADDTPFATGAYGEVPSRDINGTTEVLIGDTVVQIDTTYAAELPGVVASIEPFDLDAEVTRLTTLAEEMWRSGG